MPRLAEQMRRYATRIKIAVSVKVKKGKGPEQAGTTTTECSILFCS